MPSHLDIGSLLLCLVRFVVTYTLSVFDMLISRNLGFLDKEDGVGSLDIPRPFCKLTQFVDKRYFLNCTVVNLHQMLTLLACLCDRVHQRIGKAVHALLFPYSWKHGS